MDQYSKHQSETSSVIQSPNLHLRDMDVLYTFKIKVKGQDSGHRCIKDQWRFPNHDWDANIGIRSQWKFKISIKINIKMPNPGQEPPATSKAPNQDLKDMDVLCTFKIKIESQNLEHGYIKDQWPYPNQDQDNKPKSGTSSILQSPKWGFKGQECSLHLKN